MDYPKSIPSVGLVNGKFVDENPVAGTPGSLIPSVWGNSITEEVLNVITAAGLVPDEADVTQLLNAIRGVNKQPVVLADVGVAGAYKAVNSPALTALPATGYIQCINIASANTGASTYAPDGLAAKPIYGLGLQALQGGELAIGPAVLMYLVTAGVNSGNGAWIILESLGGASQVAPATQSRHAVNLGQYVSSLTSSGFQKSPDGCIENWGTVALSAVGAFNPQSLGGVTWYSHFYTVTLPRAYVSEHFEVVISLAGRAVSYQDSEIVAIVKSSKVTNGPSESLTSFSVSVTTPATGWVPVIHYKSTGK